MKLVRNLLFLFFALSLVSCSGGGKKPTFGKDANFEEAARINVQLASGYIRRGNYEVAKGKLEKALEADDEYVPAYTTMAVLMDIIGETTEAENYYLDALDIDPRNPELRNNYGTFLCKHDKVEDAIEQFNHAIKNQFYENPQNSHANLGYCLMKAKNPDYKKAEKHLRQALKVNPNMTTALIAMGELGLKTRRYLMTRAYMQRYHALTKPSAESLWFQIQAEKALGDQKHFLKLSRQLLKQFPESPEAEKLMKYSHK